MTYMSKNETKKFLMQGTFTAKLTTVNKDGSPHVVPVWFVLDERKNRTAKKIEDIIFTTYEDSLKATNIQRDNRVSICVEETPQFSFVTIHGTAKIVRQKHNELLKWNMVLKWNITDYGIGLWYWIMVLDYGIVQ